MLDNKDVKNSVEEITKMSKELKSHYFKNEFFVDPDKKFEKLLEKLIV